MPDLEKKEQIPAQTNQNLNIYSPASVISIVNKAFVLPEEKKIIQVKGVYQKAGKESYGGHFYDRIKDEASDFTVTLVTANLVHNQLKDNTTILFTCFLSRKIDKQGRVEFHLNFIELVNVTPNKYSDEDIKKIEIINLKLKSGIKDLDSQIKQHVYLNTPMKIVVIIGKTAIIDNDIKTALGAAVAHYSINYVRVPFTSIKDISDSILHFDNTDVDVICVARGGGDDLAVFEKPELVESIINRKKFIASAIGHADDITLFEKVADKKFAAPTAFGNYLKQVYNETIEELAKSKAKLQKDISDQLKVIYDGQIKNLNTKIDNTTKLYADEKKAMLEAHETYKRQLIDLNEKKLRDINENLIKAKAENDRLANQLNQARQVSTPNYSAIIIIIIIVIILIFIFSQK
jgi:hypothetical protein